MKLVMTVDVLKVTKSLDAFARRQLPYAAARACTAVAQLAVQDIRTKMPSIFDNPTPFTVNAFYAKPATRTDPTAYVATRDYAAKGRPAIKYLEPQILGGARVMKGFERLLSNVSGGQFAVPGRGARLNGYGNMSVGQLTQLLSRLKVINDPYQQATARTVKRLLRAKRTVAVSRNTSDYFVAHARGNGRPIGVYQLTGPGQVAPVLVFSPNAPHYTARFNPELIVTRVVERRMLPEFNKALAAAIATAKT